MPRPRSCSGEEPIGEEDATGGEYGTSKKEDDTSEERSAEEVGTSDKCAPRRL
jgi:hypothetical protein